MLNCPQEERRRDWSRRNGCGYVRSVSGGVLTQRPIADNICGFVCQFPVTPDWPTWRRFPGDQGNLAPRDCMFGDTGRSVTTVYLSASLYVSVCLCLCPSLSLSRIPRPSQPLTHFSLPTRQDITVSTERRRFRWSRFNTNCKLCSVTVTASLLLCFVCLVSVIGGNNPC